jgi:hypothetical protein
MSKSHVTTHSERAAHRRRHGLGDPRADKKYFNQMHSALYRAYIWGDDDRTNGKDKRNPFPAGKRHDEYEWGYRNADPRGDWNGRNK